MVERLEADVAVVGAGPAGIAAACRAAEAGVRVVLLEESAAAGGQIWKARTHLPRGARRWLERLARSGARLLTGAAVFDAPAPCLLAAERGGEPLLVGAERIVLATGARERFLPFPGWTLPNVVGVGGAQALLNAGASFAGRRVVVAGSGPLLLAAAAALAAAGARLALVAEQAARPSVLRFAAALWRHPGKLAQAARYRLRCRGARYRTGVWVVEASGDRELREVRLSDGRRTWAERCDVLACAFGLVPNLELPRLLGCALAGDRVWVDRLQRTSREGVYCAGEPAGIGGVELALVEGEIAGLAAAGRADAAARLAPRRARLRRFAAALEGAFAPRPELRAVPRSDTLVCRCEDVALERLDPDWQGRQAKLYTRAGMGSCQGRVCGPALTFLFGWESDTVRPPVKPVRLGCLADLAAAVAPGESHLESIEELSDGMARRVPGCHHTV